MNERTIQERLRDQPQRKVGYIGIDEEAADHIDAQDAELADLRAQLEQRTLERDEAMARAIAVVTSAVKVHQYHHRELRLGQATFNLLRDSFDMEDVNQTELDCFESKEVGYKLIAYCLEPKP